jgi:outer membrane autotransporter protein
MNNYAMHFASVIFLWACLFLSPSLSMAGMNVDVAEGETVTVTSVNRDDFILGAGNYINDLGVIVAEEDSFLFESALSPVAVVIDSATGEVRFENAGTINATNTDGNACGVFNKTAGVTIRVDGSATGTVTATASKAAGAEQTYAQGIGGTRVDGTSKLVSDSFNINVNATANGNESAYAKGVRVGVAELTNLVGNIEARAVSKNSDANVTALDCRTSGTFGTITGDLTAIATGHNAALPLVLDVSTLNVKGTTSSSIGMPEASSDGYLRSSRGPSYIASFGIYAFGGVSIDTLGASSTITVKTYSDTLNTPEGAASYRALYAYGVDTWSGDITINHLDGVIDVLTQTETSGVATSRGVCAREGNLIISDMTGTVRAIADTEFSEDSTSIAYAITAYDESSTPTKGDLTMSSSGIIEAKAPRSSNAYAIFAGNVGDVTLKNGSQTTGQIYLGGENSTLRLAKGATFTNEGNCNSTTVGAWVNGNIVNDGTMSVTGKNAIGVYVAGWNSSLTNTGTIKADGATTTAIMVVEGSALHSGSILTSNGATSCSVSSSGRLDLSSASTNSISGAVKLNNGTLNVSSGKWTLAEITASEAVGSALLSERYSRPQNLITLRSYERGASASQLEIGKLRLQGGIIDLTPRGDDKRMRRPLPPVVKNPEDASIVNVASFSTQNTIDGHLVAGQNAIISLGSSSSQDAITAIDESGLWGTSGVSAALYLGKPYALATGSSITIDGTLPFSPSTSINPDLTFGANSLLTIDATVIPEGQAALSSPSGTLTVDASAYLQILRATPGDFKIADFAATRSSAWASSNILLRNVLLYPTSPIVSGLLTVGQKSSADVFGAEGSTKRFLDSYTSAGMSGSRASASERYMDLLLASTTSDAAFNVEKAANLSGLGGVAHTAADVTSTSKSLTSRRIPASGSSLLYLARDTKEQQHDIYVTPIYQYSRTKSMSVGHYSNSFATNIYGLAIGAEVANMDWLVGAAVNFGKADTDGSKASSGFDTNNDYVSLLAYGAYILPEEFQLKGEFIYVNLDSDIDGQGLSGDVDGNVYAVGLECSRPIEHNSFFITPYVGLNYAYYDQDSYNSKNDDGDLFNVESADMFTWLLPLGVTLTKKFDIDSGWRFNTNLDAGVTFAFGDTDLTTKGRMSDSTFTDDISITTDVVDTVTGNLQLGIAAEKGHFTFELDLNGNISEHRTYRGAMLKCAVTF